MNCLDEITAILDAYHIKVTQLAQLEKYCRSASRDGFGIPVPYRDFSRILEEVYIAQERGYSFEDFDPLSVKRA